MDGLKLERMSNDAVALLENEAHGLKISVHYLLNNNSAVLRKRMEITTDRFIIVERIDVDSLALADVCQPYQQKAITAKVDQNWKLGLGQPLYTS